MYTCIYVHIIAHIHAYFLIKILRLAQSRAFLLFDYAGQIYILFNLRALYVYTYIQTYVLIVN